MTLFGEQARLKSKLSTWYVDFNVKYSKTKNFLKRTLIFANRFWTLVRGKQNADDIAKEHAVITAEVWQKATLLKLQLFFKKDVIQ